MCYHRSQMDGGQAEPGPTYDPELVRRLASAVETRAITIEAEDGCYAMGFTQEDVWQALRELDTPRCRFRKTMPSTQRPGDIFDVYNVTVGRTTVYMKFRVKTLKDGQEVVVVSFKEK